MAGPEKSTPIEDVLARGITLARIRAAGALTHAVPAELPSESETPEQHFAQAVDELLHQAFDAFGLDGDGIVTRVKRNPGPDDEVIERLELEKRGSGGELYIAQRLYDRVIHLHYLRDTKPYAVYLDADKRLEGLDAIVAVHKTLVEIIP